MKTFALPSTPTCKVVYIKDGTTYAGVISTPKTNHDLQTTLLSRQIEMAQVQRLEPIQPRGDLQWGHPASNQLDKYLSGRD